MWQKGARSIDIPHAHAIDRETTLSRFWGTDLKYGAFGALFMGHYLWGTRALRMGALGALAWGTGDWGNTYGALHQLYLNIFRTHKLYFRIIKRKFWDKFTYKLWH